MMRAGVPPMVTGEPPGVSGTLSTLIPLLVLVKVWSAICVVPEVGSWEKVWPLIIGLFC